MSNFVDLRLFKNANSAKTAIRKEGLHLVPNEIKYMDAKDSGYYVIFTVDNTEDYNEIVSRGFKAKLVKASANG